MDTRNKKELKLNQIMKIKKIILVVLITFSASLNAQNNKVFVVEDTYVQGGETREQPLGKEDSNLLRIFTSENDTKYGRISFLKFNLPKNATNLSKLTLHIPIKVFNTTGDDTLQFALDVYTLENNNWSESELTWVTKPAYAQKVGAISIPKSTDEKHSWQVIELDAKVINDLIIAQKSTTLSIGLYNLTPNKTSALMPSKEKSKKLASFITFE